MNLIKYIDVRDLIIKIKNLDVILDSDLAVLYNVETRDINKAVKNNPEKFPDGYVFEISKNEKIELVENFYRFNSLKHSTTNPKAFTEKGLYMLATILKSHIATKTTIAIIETFARIKDLSKNMKEIKEINNDSQKKQLLKKSGEIISELLDDKLSISESETTVELNFAVLKVKRTIKRK